MMSCALSILYLGDPDVEVNGSELLGSSWFPLLVQETDEEVDVSSLQKTRIFSVASHDLCRPTGL